MADTQYNVHDKDYTGINDSLFSDYCLDEMQKSESYKIGFKLYRGMYYTLGCITTISVIANEGSGNMLAVVLSLISLGIIFLFSILYAALTSAKGIMPFKYAKKYADSRMWVLWIIYALAGIFIAVFDRTFIIKTVVVIMTAIAGISIQLFAKRNFRVLEKQLKDDTENSEEE